MNNKSIHSIDIDFYFERLIIIPRSLKKLMVEWRNEPKRIFRGRYLLRHGERCQRQKSFWRKTLTISENDEKEDGQSFEFIFFFQSLPSTLNWFDKQRVLSCLFTTPNSFKLPVWRKFAFNVLARDKALSKFNLFMNNFPVFVNFFYLF